MPERHFDIYGHRGSPRRMTENTLGSLKLALEEGADGVEVDLRRLVDATPVLFHDDTAAARTVEDFTEAELRSLLQPLTIVSELEPLARSTRLILEVKRSGWERELAHLVAGWEHIVISSFDHRVLVSLRDAGYEGRTGIVYDGYIVGAAEYAKGIGASWLFPRHPYADVELVDTAHHLGMHVVPWTANRPEDWNRLRELRCDGMITDFPAEAVTWRGA